MRMILAALVGGAVLGFVCSSFLEAEIATLFTNVDTQKVVYAGLVAFLGGLWGWLAKGMVGAREK